MDLPLPRSPTGENLIWIFGKPSRLDPNAIEFEKVLSGKRVGSRPTWWTHWAKDASYRVDAGRADQSERVVLDPTRRHYLSNSTTKFAEVDAGRANP